MESALLALWALRALVAVGFGGLGYFSGSSSQRHNDSLLLIGAIVIAIGIVGSLAVGDGGMAWILTPWLVGLGIGWLRRKPRAS